MDKIILVHYISVAGLKKNDISRHMQEVANMFTFPNQDNIISYFIPVNASETRVECINPKLVSEDDFQEAKRILDRNQEIVNDLIKNGYGE